MLVFVFFVFNLKAHFTTLNCNAGIWSVNVNDPDTHHTLHISHIHYGCQPCQNKRGVTGWLSDLKFRLWEESWL